MSDTREAPPFLDLKASLKRPLKVALLTGIVTAVLSLFLPNYYQSKALILPSDSGGSMGMGQLAAAAAAFGVGLPSGGGSDDTFEDILESRWMAENLLKTRFTFHQRPFRFMGEVQKDQTLLDYLDVSNLDQGVLDLKKDFFVSRDLKSKLLTVSFECRSQDLSQQVVRRALALLSDFVLDQGRTRGGEKAAFTRARLADARREMDRAEDDLLKFLETNRNYQVSGDPAIRLKGARLDMELKLRQQLVTTLSMNLEQALLDAKNDVPVLNILDPGNLPIEKSKPKRSLLVLSATLLAGFFAWGRQEWSWIRAHLTDAEDSTIN